LSPKGEFWHCLEQALDLSKNVSEHAKRDLGNSPFMNEKSNFLLTPASKVLTNSFK